MREVRKLVGGMPILIPGIGAQGGSVSKTVKAAGGRQMIINSSRGIIFASNDKDFMEAAHSETKKLHDEITEACKKEN
jgi:orotidine-5'-phosphate decarboxylase